MVEEQMVEGLYMKRMHSTLERGPGGSVAQ